MAGARTTFAGGAGAARGAGVRAAWAAIAAAAALLFAPAASAAQEGMVRGRAWSDEGIPIAGATARLFPEADSTAAALAETDRLGFFAFSGLAPGAYVLALTRIGHEEFRERLQVAAGAEIEVEAVMARAAVALEGIVVEAERSRARARFEETAGATVQEIGGADLKSIPGIAETDPLRAIEVLPGVTTVSDFSAAFNVRGGSADQNLILLDDIPIYNPFHLGNLFSVFNADMVQRAELRAGGFPAEYGGRVSSVLSVETDSGDGEFSVDAGVSVLASRLAVDWALPSAVEDLLGLATTRWRVSGRRSYFDALLKPWTEFPYHLTDLQGAFEGWTKGGNRFRLTGYTGSDVIDLSRVGENPLGVQWTWGNDAFGGSWTNPMRGGGSLVVRGAFSRFQSEFGFTDLNARFSTRISRATAQADIERRPTPQLRWKSGAAFNRREYENHAHATGAVFEDDAGRGVEFGGYTQLQWDPRGAPWLVEAGLRVDHWRPSPGSASTTASPRLAVKRFLGGGDAAVRMSAGRYTQVVHSLRDEELPLGLDVWVLAGPNAPSVVSDQAQLGVESFFGADDGWFASLEGYYRTFDGVIAVNPAEDPGDPLDDLLAGEGQAYGADLFVRRDLGAATGWLSVSFLKTDRTFPEARSGVTPKPLVTYPPVFDRRVDVDLVLRRPLGWWGLVGGMRANFGTGLPYTRAVGTHGVYYRRPVERLLEYDFRQAVILGPRNGERYPARHRLDISLRKTVEKDWGTIVPHLSVINVYNQKNVLFYFFNYHKDPPVRSGVSMIPILPTIGVEVSF